MILSKLQLFTSIFYIPQYYYAHQLEHQRVGRVIVESNDDVLIANLDTLVKERIIRSEHSETLLCRICNATFDAISEINRHIQIQHVYKMFPKPVEPRKEFICDICGMPLKTKESMRTHLLIHTNTKPHPCRHCGKMFRQTSDRNVHERQHTGEVRQNLIHQKRNSI